MVLWTITGIIHGHPTVSYTHLDVYKRQGLVINASDAGILQRVAERERAPFYNVGKITGDMNFSFVHSKTGEAPINMPLEYFFGKPPRTVMADNTTESSFRQPEYDQSKLRPYI